MDIKESIGRVITQEIRDAEKSLRRYQKTLTKLKAADGCRLNYIVNLRSLWESQGEGNTTTKYMGTVEGAVQAAEQEFMRVNNRRDVQADYQVMVVLGKTKVFLPEECWKPYASRAKK
ncbi:hypothetical protein FJZ18_04215 [Candidatus Pacearchaeota archaeon]|nr:hypothetical protein [Candidatus Pacearchaeota archaeon]